MCRDGSEAHPCLMLNYEITKVLAKDHQDDLNHSAVVARLARRVRRMRRQDGQVPDTGLESHIELPNHTHTDHALAA
jgi:hypothetical protein